MNVDQAKNSSRSFHLASGRCKEQRPLGPGQVEFLAVPAIVCEAFAVELGLKTLIMRKSGSTKVKGHNLAELFGKLFTSEQMALIDTVGLPETDFRKELVAVSTAFEDWRYVFEASTQKSVNVQFLGALSTAVQAML
jgi:hypothetical protein